jgi:hypothetical protein
MVVCNICAAIRPARKPHVGWPGRSHKMLQEIAHQLEDERLRRSFLENFVANRQIVAAAQAAGIVTAPVTHVHG